VDTVPRWTGREAKALRRALRMSVRGFAEYLGVAARTIANWEQRAESVEPKPWMQETLDTALRLAAPDVQERFHQAVDAPATDANRDVAAGLDLPTTPTDGIAVLRDLWRADLDAASPLAMTPAAREAWNQASLTWLLTDREVSRPLPPSGEIRVGQADVRRVRVTTQVFSELDDRFGGGHARHALIQFLAGDAGPLLSGRYTDDVGRSLFSAVAESTLLAAWMSYDAGLHGAAQRYFIQALGLAQAGDDQPLAGSILDAASHQATYLGQLREAANLAGAARLGAGQAATPTLTSHFHAMEARAMARLGDEHGCSQAMSQSVRAFERRQPADDPEWMAYFDEAELAAELSHCFKDLGQATPAASYATQSLAPSADSSPRSRFFVEMVLATAQLEAGNPDEACDTAATALKLGEDLVSARCVSYLQDFRSGLAPYRDVPAVRDFNESAEPNALWQQTG
jgi:transcriptional regulator with XRE-family HTH domain